MRESEMTVELIFDAYEQKVAQACWRESVEHVLSLIFSGKESSYVY